MTNPYILYADGAGWCVQWYRDDDDNSGYGDNPQIATYYAERADCEQLAKQSVPPAGTKWFAIQDWEPSAAPGSAAWCET